MFVKIKQKVLSHKNLSKQTGARMQAKREEKGSETIPYSEGEGEKIKGLTLRVHTICREAEVTAIGSIADVKKGS